MSAQREMTLDEYLESKLPCFHLARRQLQDLREERDALAALCQEGAAVLERTANDTLDGRNMTVRLREANTTSLARLKAKWQAEAMEGWLEQMRYMEGLNTFDCMESAELYAEELRRQAEEGEDDE